MRKGMCDRSFTSSTWTTPNQRATLIPVKARKLIAILLSLGYLSAVHCRAACVFSMPSAPAAEEHENGCHHEQDEPKGHGSKVPCCMTHIGGDEALLPTAAPTSDHQAVFSFVAVVPDARPAVLPLRLLGSKQNHDPPWIASDGILLSSLSPRAPPAVL